MLIINPFSLTFTETANTAQIRTFPPSYTRSNDETVHVAIGSVPIGETQIRVIGASRENNYPKQMTVPTYKMVVWDDTTHDPKNVRKNMSEYFVTRDAPEYDVKGPVNEPWIPEGIPIIGGVSTYNVINTAFEPATQHAEYNLIPLAYPPGTNLEAYAFRTKEGSERLPAIPNESSQRKDKNIATGVMIHVGGFYERPGFAQNPLVGSWGCFGVISGNAMITRFVADLKRRQELNKKARKGTRITIEMAQRPNVIWRWEIDKNGRIVANK